MISILDKHLGRADKVLTVRWFEQQIIYKKPFLVFINVGIWISSLE